LAVILAIAIAAMLKAYRRGAVDANGAGRGGPAAKQSEEWQWEVSMMVRLIASIFPISLRPTTAPPIWSLVLPADTLKGMIRLSFAAYRLSLPPSVLANNRKAHDQKIA
jgi:hypothetical protein